MNNKQEEPDLYGSWEVDEASRSFVTQVSNHAKHHSDDLSFISLLEWKASQISESIKQDFQEGIKSTEETLTELYNEGAKFVTDTEEVIHDLYAEGKIFLKEHEQDIVSGIGLAAGGAQIIAACVIDYSTFGLATVLAVPLLAHGLNNVYENGAYFLTGNSTDGPLRVIYQDLLGDKDRGDLAYLGIDMTLAGYGLFRKVPNIKKKYDIQLYTWLGSHYEMAFKSMGKAPLGFEILSDSTTGHSIYKKVKEIQNKEQ